MNKLLLSTAVTFAIVTISSAQTPSPAAATAAKSGGMPYTEGPVWTLTMIRTKPGLEDEYLRQITGTVKPVYEAEKNQKLVLDYKILIGDAMGPNDANIIILVEFANMAAFDGLREKTDPILQKVMGGDDQQRSTMVKRLDVREILGTKTMREITLK
jgi:hypothetical protein